MSFFNVEGIVAARGLDSNADSVSGAQLFVYEQGTTTPVTTYTDRTGVTANAFPVVADASGSFGGVYVAANTIKVDLRTAAGASLPGYPIDDIEVGGGEDAAAARAARVDVSSFAEVGTTDRIEDDTASVWVASYYAGGADSGFHMRKTATQPDHNLWIQNVATGTYWEPVPVLDSLQGYQVGLVRDALFLNPSDKLWYSDVGFTTRATDNAQRLQDLNDAASYQYKCSVHYGHGKCAISKTVHIFYGTASLEQFKGGQKFLGGGPNRRGDSPNAGFAFCKEFNDAPGVAIQGARIIEVGSFSVLGTTHEFLTLDRTDSTYTEEASWTAILADRLNSPDCGVAIDPYSGTAPASPYPDVTFPAFLGHDGSQYGKGPSSEIHLHDIFARWNGVGILQQPNSDANGDFTSLNRCTLEQNFIGASVCNSQSRNMNFTDCVINNNYIGISGAHHGSKLGQLGVIDNCQLSQNAIQLEIQSTFPLTVSNTDAETTFKMVRIIGSSSNDAPLYFFGCRVDFDHNDDKGHPAELIESDSLTINKPIIWHAGEVTDFTSVFDVGKATKFRFTGDVRFKSSERGGTGSVAHYIALAHNDTAGGLVGNWTATVPPAAQCMESQRLNLSTDAFAGIKTTCPDRNTDTGRLFGVSRYQKEALYRSEAQWGTEPMLRRPPRTENKSGWTLGTFSTVDGKPEATFTRTAGIGDGEAIRFGMYEGGTIYDSESKTTFFIKARSGADLTVVAQNNYRSDGAGGLEFINAFNTTGSLTFEGTGYYRPGFKIDEVLHDTSTAVTSYNYSFATTFLSDATNGIAVGDSLVSDEVRERVHLATGATNELEVTAFDTGAQTITFAGAAARRTLIAPLTAMQRY